MHHTTPSRPGLLTTIFILIAGGLLSCDTVDTHVAPVAPVPSVGEPPDVSEEATGAEEPAMPPPTTPVLNARHVGEGPEALLNHLAERLHRDPHSTARRVATAEVVVVGAVLSRNHKAWPASPAIKSDPALVEAYVVEGELSFVRAELDVKAAMGRSAEEVRVVVWPETRVVSTADVGPGLRRGEVGVVFLRPHEGSVLGREAVVAFPGSVAPAPPLPCFVRGDVEALAAGVSWWDGSRSGRAKGPGAAIEALAHAHGLSFQLALVALASADASGARALTDLLQNAGHESARTLLIRATLLQMGRDEDALAGLELAALTPELLAPLDVTVDGARISGVEPSIPLSADVPPAP